MKAHAPQTKQPRTKASPLTIRLTPHALGNQAAHAAPRESAEALREGPGAPAPNGFAHDFSRIPASSEAPVVLQAKLTVNTPGDAFEQEAGRVSEKLSDLPEPRLQRACACGGDCPDCGERHGDDERLQAKREHSGQAGESPETSGVREVLRSPGQPLDSGARAFMEARFGADFSRVRVHDDARAAETARGMEALAYTLGQDIVFGAGQYAPGTTAGRQLLAHELAHTIQQRSSSASPLQTKLRLSRAGDPDELAADRAADAVMRGGRATALGPVPGGFVQRQHQRTCGRAPGDVGNPSTVNCTDGAEYEVRTTIVPGRTQTSVNALGGLDRSTIYLRITACRGRDEVRVFTGVDVAPPLQRLIENILRGSPGVGGVRIEPEARISWARSREFEVEAYGGPVIEGGAPRTGWRAGVRGQVGRLTGEAEVGSDPTLTGPGGGPEIHGTVRGGVVTDPVRTVRCPTVDQTVTHQCTRITRTTPVAPTPADDVQAYVFFRYATADVIAPTPRILRGSDELTGESLTSLARQGFRVQSIDAHTSPEGRRGEPLRRGGFIGNDALSELRRDAAETWLRSNCPECAGAEMRATAESELYSGWRRPGVELEGDPLTHRAREGFLGHDVEPVDPLRRPEHDRLETLPAARQRTELYPLLRRAVIHLHREGTPGQPSRRVPGQPGACPDDVIAAMQTGR